MADYTWSSNDGEGANSEKDEKNLDEIFERLESLQDWGLPSSLSAGNPELPEPSVIHLDHELRTENFWDSLQPEQLHYLRTMLLSIVQSGSDPRAAYHLGAAEAVLRVKYKLCPQCGQSHSTLTQHFAEGR